LQKLKKYIKITSTKTLLIDKVGVYEHALVSLHCIEKIC
jgi:hypothetical protein